MSELNPPANPQRPYDVARLELAKLRIEDGISLETIFHRVTETSAATMEVERVGVWLLVDEGKSLRCVDLYELSTKSHSKGTTLWLQDFPDYFEALSSRKTLPAEIAASDPRTSTLAEVYLAPLGIASILDAGIFVAGEVIGVVCHEHVGSPREWTTEDRDFAGSMADLVALKIRAAELEDARIALQTQASQLSEVRRHDALATMAGGIAHDFNNILTVILGGIQIILESPTSPSAQVLAEQISVAVEQGKMLTRELMEFSRPGPHASRVVRPAEIISALLPILRTAATDRCPVSLEVRSNAGKVLIAPDQLERLMLNLVINARDAMTNSGAINVILSAVDAVDDDQKLGRYYLIEVSDSGMGIAPEVLSRVFDPFFTTKPLGQGTGLGLAIVKQIVSYAGGFIRIETKVNEGTIFRVYLPLVSHQV